jgi:hypothetical protein
VIDALAIILSTMAVLYVLVRAIYLDRSLPWFESGPAPQGDAPPSAERLKG